MIPGGRSFQLPDIRSLSGKLRQSSREMKLSIIVVFFNMRREAERTLYSLSPAHQMGVCKETYEIIAIDNNSSAPLTERFVTKYGENFKYIFYETQSKSPVEAINTGVNAARGEFVAIIVDGARMASPGLVADSLRALSLFEYPLVGSLSWHLGPEVQNVSMLNGYCEEVEDELLQSISWPDDGYRLFEISVLAQSSSRGFLNGVPNELSWLCLPRQKFLEVGGFDMGFQSPGGGLMNHDFLNRALSMPGVRPVMLLGEGVFHQFHGGVATNVPMADHPIQDFKNEYERIRRAPYEPFVPEKVHYLGTFPPTARRFLG